jgi:hypothetical protein
MRPKAIPPMALAMSADITGSATSCFESANSFWIDSSAKLKRRKSVASSIHPSCAAKSARQAFLSTPSMKAAV